jgi:hypothetical protein
VTRQRPLLEEMFPANPTKGQTIDTLMHSSIEIDQKILCEVESIEESLQGGKDSSQQIELSLPKIVSYTEENSKKVTEARRLVREID